LAESIAVVLPSSIVQATTPPPRVAERLKRWFQNMLAEDENEPDVGVAVQLTETVSPRVRKELEQDLELFLSNWIVAESSFRLQHKLLRERMEMVKQFGQGA
jgi:hypothetical protein